MPPRTDVLPKHRQVFTTLKRQIETGRWKPGDRLPSEAELVRTFDASRITVGRAVRDLQSAGLVDRRAGSGTYVASAGSSHPLSFGLRTKSWQPASNGEPARLRVPSR